MNSKITLWMAVAAAIIFAVGRDTAIGDLWRAVEQPELKEALERAPVLQTKSLGEPARGVNVWERWLVPNHDGKTWDVLQIYFKEYYGSTWLYAVDLGTGQVRKQRLADDHQFYLSGRALGFDGKYYIATPSRRTWSMDMFVYDPATNTVEERGEIVPGLGGEVRPLVTGPDGRIYGTGTRDNKVGLYIYDPKLGKVVKDFGPVGPGHPNGAWSRYVMGVDDTHAYIASGMIPAWYLVAINLTTGEEKVLLESPTDCVMDIIEHFPGAYARVPQDSDAPDKEYWLYHGQAIPKTNDTPPWPKQASPWDKAVPKPEVYFDQIDPDAEGNAMLWYRSREDAAKAPKDPPHDDPQTLGWKSVRLEGVESYPHRINPMSILPDGRLYGTGDDYAGVFVFDPRTDQTTILGPRPGLAPYTQIVCGDKLYSSGYSGGHLFVYDPTRPWTLSKGGPPGHPAPDQADARSNPRYLGDFDKTTRVGLMHSSALGADGKIYFGGFGLRHYTGGGFGWYDPKTRKMDGFWMPLSGYAVQWIALALDGRLIVISTIRAADERNDNRAPEEAKLFVYDVSEQKIVREITPIAKGRTTGLITEVAPGRLLGLTSNPEHPDRSILYGVEVTTGQVLFTKGLPSPVSVDSYWPHWVDPSYEYLAFVHGPDGFVWTYLKDVLVRIDPKDASVHVVGKVDPVGWPTFVGNDVYFSGPEQLRRIRNLVPMPTSEAQWSPRAPLSGTGAIGSPGGTHPVVCDGDTAHAVWVEEGRIHYRRSNDAGATWDKAVPLTSEGTAEYPCSLELAASFLHLIWPDRRDGSWEVYYKRSADGGVTWGPDTRLTHGVNLFRLGTTASGPAPHIVLGSKSLVVPTPGGTHTWGEIYYQRSTDGGLSWQSPMRLTLPDASAMRPAVAASGRDVHVTWFDRRDSTQQWDWEVYYKRSTDGGATWGPDVRMTHTPTHTRHPQILATGQGVVCCIWEDGQVFDGATWSGDPALYAAVSTDRGKTWKTPRRITSINAPRGWATHAKSYSFGRRIYLAWTDAPEGPGRPRAACYMTSADGGLTWEDPQRLTNASDGEWWAAGVAGTGSYAVAVISQSDTLSCRVRKEMEPPRNKADSQYCP